MRDQDYFSHTGLNSSTPWDRACNACYALGCGPMTAMAENIAAGNNSAQATFTQWVNSPGHCSNMMGANSNEVGVGYAIVSASPYTHYWVQNFGNE